MIARRGASRLTRVTFLLVSLLWFGCRPASSLPVVKLSVVSSDDKTVEIFRAEVAATNEERAKGLMFRRHVGRHEGMLFLFPTEKRLSFWMKNTLIPLDMIFIGSDWQIVGIVENAAPLSEDPRSVAVDSQYVLEVAGGTVARLGIRVGGKVQVRGNLPPIQ